MNIKYRSNNSGGSWWLTDQQWQALEDAGWTVEWGGYIDEGEPRPTKASEVQNRFLGAIATDCSIELPTIREAILSWEQAAGVSAAVEGCNCCGPPHNFSWDGGGVSGEEIAKVRGDPFEVLAYEELKRKLGLA